jgi:phenylpropionate dioxygenase-like ring-hydroxylating dioxygenase large terminal subunit
MQNDTTTGKMFLMNSWYVAATTEEINERRIVSRKVLNEPVVIFRTEEGSLAALRDACIHRSAPLSLGHVVGETIQCKYHGARYGIDGRCVHIPGQKTISSKAVVPSFPVRERFGFIWVWFGDPSLAQDESTIPEILTVTTDSKLRSRYGLFEAVKVNYRLLNDNLFDITHAEFVHPESFGGEEVRFYRNAKKGSAPIDRGLAFEIENRSIHFQTYAQRLGDEGGPLWRTMMAQARKVETWQDPIDFNMKVDWYAPCFTSFHVYIRPCAEPNAVPVELHDFHAATPESAGSTHYFYQVALGYGGDQEISEYSAAARAIFSQDIQILEGQQNRLGDLDVMQVENVSFNGDHLQLAGRRIVDRLIEAENKALADA